MKRQSSVLVAVTVAIAWGLFGHGQEAPKKQTHPRFLPPPLDDEWTKWIVGEWEGAGQSSAGQGKGIVRFESALNGQFLISRGEAKIAEMTPQQVDYLKRNMQASDEEIARFHREGYKAMEVYTIDQATGEVVGYLFDSLRCTAKGRGKRHGNRETIAWEWASGHKSTRITERAGDDLMLVVEKTPMPDGTVMEDKGEMKRRRQVLDKSRPEG